MIHDECNFLISMLETKADFLEKMGVDLLDKCDELKAENDKLRIMVARYADIAATEQTNKNEAVRYCQAALSIKDQLPNGVKVTDF